MAPVIPDMARGWPRTENRVVGMLLQAVPKDIYEDLVANRHHVSGSSHVQAVHRLPTWRTSGKNFSTTNVGGLVRVPSNNAAEMVNSIRKWRRWVVRAEELQLVLPRSSGFGRSGRKNE